MEPQPKSARQLLARSRSEPLGVPDDATVLAAMQKMADHDIGALLVMRGNQLVGVLSERDCVRKVELCGRAAATTAVRDVMTDKIVYAAPDDPLARCMVLMKTQRIRHLPVIENGHPIGVVSIRDVLEELVSDEEERVHALEQERLYFTVSGGTY